MNAMLNETIRTEPLQGAVGVRWSGVDAAAIAGTPHAVASLRAAMQAHRVVLIEGASLDATQLHDLALTLGPAGRVRFTEASFPAEVRDFVLNAASPLSSGAPAPASTHLAQVWHSDYTATTPTAAAVLLQSTVSPDHSGALSFLDAVAAYESLPDALKQRIEPLSAIHHPYPGGVEVENQGTSLPREKRERGVSHPLVARHASGARALFLPHRVDSLIPGLDDGDAEQLLSELWQHVDARAAAGELTTLAMRDGDIVLWDNTAALHRRAAWDPQAPRATWLVTILA